ncbi:MAG: hypothetical protein AB1442_12985 [Nitrospirota bacterium]
MQYISICNPKSKAPRKVRAEDMPEWIKVSKDVLLHSKCRAIKCYEMKSGSSKKLMIMIDTDEPEALKLLSRDFGNNWKLETYPLHYVEEPMEEDHSIVAG